MKDGVTTTIPVVSNPIDIISNIVVPAVPEDILSKIITIIKIVILLLNQLFGLFGISFKDIFNFIFVKPFKWLKGKFGGNKKKKSNKNKKWTKKINRWEVYYNRQNKHPGITWEEYDDIWVNFTVTHSNNYSVSNTKLSSNPNKDDSRDTYIRNTPNKTKKIFKRKAP